MASNKEQQTEIVDLKAEVKRQQKENDRLQRRVDALVDELAQREGREATVKVEGEEYSTGNENENVTERG